MTNRILLVMLILTTISILVLASMFYGQLHTIKATQTETNVENIKTNQFLLSTINWSTQRNKVILFMREQIKTEWELMAANGHPVNVDLNKAYVKAEAIMKECERYDVGIDPLSMLAVQRTESRFLDSAVSCMNARGSWQFVPSTALLLCQALGLTYSDKVYSDPVVSTRLAGKYFEVLYAVYPDSLELARFADYNGGPLQAQLYIYNRKMVCEETRTFIDSVSKYRDIYRERLLTFRPEKSLNIGGKK